MENPHIMSGSAIVDDKDQESARRLVGPRIPDPIFTETIKRQVTADRDPLQLTFPVGVFQCDPFFPTSYEEALLYARCFTCWLLNSEETHLMEKVLRDGTFQLMMIVSCNQEFFQGVEDIWVGKKRTNELFVQRYSETIAPDFDVEHPKIEQALSCYRYSSTAALIRSTHAVLNDNQAVNRCKTLLIMAYKLSERHAKEEAQTFMTCRSDFVPLLNDGANILSNNHDFYKRVAWAIVFAHSNTIQSYVRDMLRFSNMTWHRYSLEAVKRYRATYLFADPQFRGDFDSYLRQILQLLPNRDPSFMPFLSVARLATNDDLAPKIAPTLFAVVVFYLQSVPSASGLRKQYMEADAFKDSALTQERIRELVERPLPPSSISASFSSPLVDALYGSLDQMIPAGTGEDPTTLYIQETVNLMIKDRLDEVRASKRRPQTSLLP